VELVAENLDGTMNGLVEAGAHFAEYDTGEVYIYRQNELNESQLQDLQDQLLAEGVVLTEPIAQDARMIVIKFRVEMLPFAAIAAIVAAVGGLIGFTVFKDKVVTFLKAPFGVPWWVWAVGAVGVGIAVYKIQHPSQGSGSQVIIVNPRRKRLCTR